MEANDSFDDEFHQIVFPVGDPEIAKFRAWEAKQARKLKIKDFEEEEDRDNEGLMLYVRKYNKLWKLLFSKYSNSGYSIKDVSNFDKIK